MELVERKNATIPVMEPRFSGGTLCSILTKLTELSRCPEELKETMKNFNQNIKISVPRLEPKTSRIVSMSVW
jgi:hypothetical protein